MDPVVDLVRSRLPACGATTVVAIDGPSGAGKSSLADRLAEPLGARVLRTDDFVPGWRGLALMPPVLARDLLGPLARDEVARPQRWSWVRDTWVRGLPVEPGGVLLLDGCGSGSRPLRPFLGALVWVEADAATRRERALARDGETYEPWWDVWATQERALFAAEDTRAAADLVLRTDGER